MKKIDEKGVVTLSISSLDENTKITPTNTPANVVGEFLKQLTSLVSGNGVTERDIFFDSISDGCTQVAVRVDSAKQEQFMANLIALKDDAYQPMRRQLGKQKYKATIAVGESGFEKNILPETKIFEYEVYQEETFRGELFSIGGKDDTVPMKLLTEDKEVIYLTANTRGLARKLGEHLFRTIECSGKGLIRLNPDNLKWYPVLNKFRIYDFEVLPEANYDDFLDRFRKIDSEWKHLEDPLGKIESIRNGEI